MSNSAAGGTRARRAAKGGARPTQPSTSASVPTMTPAEATAKAPPAGNTARRDLDPDVVAALEEQRDFLLRSLEDLEAEHDAGDVDDVDYAALKDDYTARAAAVIKTIEARRSALTATRRPRRWGAVAATVAAVAVLGLGAGWLVATSAGQREPGDTITGDIRESTIDELAKAGGYTAEATAAQQSGDSDAAVAAFQNALDSYRKVLDQQPENVEALTYRGWLLHVLALQADGAVAQELDGDALNSIDRAVAADPTYPDARIFRAIIYERLGRNVDAATDLDGVDPERVPPAMAEMVAGLQQRVQAGG